MKAIANLKKSFVNQIVVVWKTCAECPGDGCTACLHVLGESARGTLKCANSAIFQVVIH